MGYLLPVYACMTPLQDPAVAHQKTSQCTRESA